MAVHDPSSHRLLRVLTHGCALFTCKPAPALCLPFCCGRRISTPCIAHLPALGVRGFCSGQRLMPKLSTCTTAGSLLHAMSARTQGITLQNRQVCGRQACDLP